MKISGHLIWLQYLNRTNIHKYPLFKIISKIFLRTNNYQLKIIMHTEAIKMKCELNRSEKWGENYSCHRGYSKQFHLPPFMLRWLLFILISDSQSPALVD